MYTSSEQRDLKLELIVQMFYMNGSSQCRAAKTQPSTKLNPGEKVIRLAPQSILNKTTT